MWNKVDEEAKPALAPPNIFALEPGLGLTNRCHYKVH